MNQNSRKVYVFTDPARLRIGAKHYRGIPFDKQSVIHGLLELIFAIDDAPHKARILMFAEEETYCMTGVDARSGDKHGDFFQDLAAETLSIYTIKALCKLHGVASYLNIKHEPPHEYLGRQIAINVLMEIKDLIADGTFTAKELGLPPDWENIFK